MKTTNCIISLILALASASFLPSAHLAAANTEQTKQTKSSSKAKAKGKPAAKKGKAAKRKVSNGKESTRPQESSAELRRKQQAAQQEVKKTREEIAANDKAVKTGVAELGKISAEINISRQRVADMSTQIKTLDGKIGSLQSEITAGEKQLARMRAKYLDAVKKMRLRRGNQSALAFIFSSKDFNQALRRMRWLKQFSEWKDRQSDLINKNIQKLKYQTELLAQTKTDKNRVLKSQLSAQKDLEQQHSQQDALVADLRKNGDALRSHLQKKQAEANDLRNRVAAVIAHEQALAEQRRREEEQRLRLQAEAEARAKEEAEARRRQTAEAEKIRQEKEKEKANQQAELTAEAKKADKKEKTKKAAPKSEIEQQNGKASGADYARARKRRSRKDNATSAPAVPKTQNVETAASNSSHKNANSSKPSAKSSGGKTDFGNFAAAKGSLPRPVSGSFKVTSPFGRHPLPDLPDVVYDNPGIDALVSNGASAQAVFPGRVSGVYMLPGYNTVVIINHGGYYTIYGNIASTAVKVGDSVRQGQNLGRLAPDPDMPGNSTIHFEVWKNREKLNPMQWIR